MTHNLKYWKELRGWGKKVGREGMSKEVLKALDDFDGSYKECMILSGKLRAIALAANCDDYWGEKMNMGYQRQISQCAHQLSLSDEDYTEYAKHRYEEEIIEEPEPTTFLGKFWKYITNLHPNCDICKVSGKNVPLYSDGVGLLMCKKCWGATSKK